METTEAVQPTEGSGGLLDSVNLSTESQGSEGQPQ